MIITINKAHGSVAVNVSEIEMLIKEQLKMVPGITSTADESFVDRVKLLLTEKGAKSVRVYPISRGVVGITCHVRLFEGANFANVSKEAQSIIKYSIEKKYELEVDHIDIIIEGFVER